MLYTRKGDDGKTKTFGCDQRMSKSSAIAEALGSLDEINSYLGVIKAKIKADDNKTAEILNDIQNDLFIIQAQVAGADKKILEKRIKDIEEMGDSIEKALPPIKTFLISGANEISANFDFARTLARRAERRVVAVSEENVDLSAQAGKIDSQTLVYLNRLSSLLYAYARSSAVKSGTETAPKY